MAKNSDLKFEIESLSFGYRRPNLEKDKHYADRLQEETEAWEYLTEVRGFNSETLKAFNIGIDERGCVSIPIYKNNLLIDFKFRNIKEKAFYRYPGSETWVFNEKAIDKVAEKKTYKELIICEGEFDAMALYQLGFENVISPTDGAKGKTEWIKKLDDRITKLFICYDNDEPGQDGARALAERIGLEKCYNVKFEGVKDANEFLLSGKTKVDFKKLLSEASRFDIKGVYKLADVIDILRKNKLERVPTGIPELDSHIKGGIPRKSLVIISGVTGAGKSTFLLNLLIGHANQKKPILLVSLENDIYATMQRALEIKYKKSSDSFDQFAESDWERVKIELVDYPLYLDTSLDTVSFERIKEVVTQAKRLYGIEFFAFDHLHFISHDYKFAAQSINKLVTNFKLLARDLDVSIYLISHVRKTDGNNLTKEDLKDSSGIAQLSDFVWFIKSNNEGYWLEIDKARMSLSHIKVPLAVNFETGVFTGDPSREAVSSFGEGPVDATSKQTTSSENRTSNPEHTVPDNYT